MRNVLNSKNMLGLSLPSPRNLAITVWLGEEVEKYMKNKVDKKGEWENLLCI